MFKMKFKELMKHLILFLILSSIIFPIKAQERKSISEMTPEDYINLQLPPLDILYENALQAPSIKIQENQKKLQERLLKKEKKNWLGFFSARAGYAYGKTDNYGTLSDINTPIFTQYTGVAQHYYNVGANINIPFDDLFDLRGKTRRQRLAVEKAELEKQQAILELKKLISSLYVDILSQISALKTAAEATALARADYLVAEKDFQNGVTTSSSAMMAAKKVQIDMAIIYENIRSRVSSEIYELELISNTPIISIPEN